MIAATPLLFAFSVSGYYLNNPQSICLNVSRGSGSHSEHMSVVRLYHLYPHLACSDPPGTYLLFSERSLWLIIILSHRFASTFRLSYSRNKSKASRPYTLCIYSLVNWLHIRNYMCQIVVELFLDYFIWELFYMADCHALNHLPADQQEHPVGGQIRHEQTFNRDVLKDRLAKLIYSSDPVLWRRSHCRSVHHCSFIFPNKFVENSLSNVLDSSWFGNLSFAALFQVFLS